MKKRQLFAYIQKKLVGVVEWDRAKDRLTFSYDEEWRNKESAHPLSLSMPLAISVHQHNKIDPFLWGLLPDNGTILNEWGKNFQVSPRHAFSLLSHIGEECAGAVQFVRPERAETWLNLTGTGHIKWLTHEEMSHRIDLLVHNHGASRLGTDEGHFSLAGAQAKTALRFDENTQKWGVPIGNEPTTIF